MMARLVDCYLEAHPDADVPGSVRTNAPTARSIAALVGDRPIGRTGDVVLECAKDRG
jgi:hypothetical protein